MLLPKFLSPKISPEKSLDFLSQKSVVRPALFLRSRGRGGDRSVSDVLEVKNEDPDTVGYLRWDKAKRYVDDFQSWMHPGTRVRESPGTGARGKLSVFNSQPIFFILSPPPTFFFRSGFHVRFPCPVLKKSETTCNARLQLLHHPSHVQWGDVLQHISTHCNVLESMSSPLFPKIYLGTIPQCWFNTLNE